MERAIHVDGLGKKYLLRHEAGGRRYTALRDVVAQKAAGVFRRTQEERNAQQEEFWALRHVGFEIKRGEAVGIIGRNGAGKSTLLKLLSRIVAPSEGSIEINGRVASLLEVGTGFHPELTGRENIYLNGAIVGMTCAEIRRKFDEIVAFAEVERFLDTPVKRYSSGMYTRLAFAVSAHLEPEILIVDEVLAVGDAEFQKKCLGKMNEARSSDRTVLFVSHNMAAVRQLCTTGILLERGKVVAQGPIGDVVNRYLRSDKTSDYTVPLADKERRWGRDPRMELLSLEINRGQPLVYGERCELTLHARSTMEFEKISFEIGFSGLDGVRYLTYDSLIAGRRGGYPKGDFSMTLVIPELPAQSTLYTLDLGVNSGGSSLDYLMGAAQVEILPGPNGATFRTGGANGTSLPGEWELQTQ